MDFGRILLGFTFVMGAAVVCGSQSNSPTETWQVHLICLPPQILHKNFQSDQEEYVKSLREAIKFTGSGREENPFQVTPK